ncbi:MAG: aminopeptidase [Alphaproteobacteria bacterium]|nr:aminopeptidase [Alphaproteobacteria bacterium]MBL7098953.1 aminopeptidase [Alphaproteobacteria bacterium]
MFFKIAGFEARYQMRSPVFWVAGLIFFLLPFAATTISQVQVGGVGSVWKNSPYAILQVSGVLDVFFVFALIAFVANIIVRDDETGYGPIVRSTRITKFDYLFGRFTGAFGAGMVMALAIPLGILVGSFMPWIDPKRIGPFQAEHYLFDYFVMMLPTLFVLAAAFFALATATRSMMATYVGAVAFLIGYLVLTTLFQKPQYDHIVGILEPFGMGALAEIVKYWTTSDRNTMLPPLADVMLINRAIYLGLAFVLLAIAYWTYRFEARAGSAARPEKKEAVIVRAQSGPLPAPHFDAGSIRVMALKWTRFEMGQVFKSPAFFVLLALGLLNALGSLLFVGEQRDWVVLPVTNLTIDALNGAFTIIPLIVAIYYAGELVWRERDRRTHEVLGAVPVPDWAFVVPKIAAITLVLVFMLAVSVLTAMIVQATKNYTDFEIWHYAAWYVVPNAIEAVELAALAIFVQTVVSHKYVGWGVMALVLVAQITLGNLGYDHHLYIYGSSYNVPLSDMNGQGQFWIGRAWFQVYWLAFALILSILAYGLWRRGAETRFVPRLARLPRRLRGFAGVLMAMAVIVWAGAGAFIYYNTVVLNEYRNSVGDEAWTADYERTLYKYHTIPQPKVTDITMNVAIYPHDIRIVSEGRYAMVNATAKPLTVVHVRWPRELTMESLSVSGAHVQQRFERFNYVIYAFDKPLLPGEKTSLSYRAVWQQKGFKNSANLTRIVDNGTFVNNQEIAPNIGMDQTNLLRDPVKRRRQHLAGDMRPAKLDDPAARYQGPFGGDTNWVNSDITVSTVADQTPIAPGYKVSDVTRDGRRTARFRSDAPVLAFFSMQSAAYAERHAKWRDVDLTVYYDPHHPYQVDRMLSSMKASLEVFDEAFGPYQFKQARILEFPGYATFAQSFANTIPFSESIGFIQDDNSWKDDPEKVDLVTFVTAHELGHQWWGHQLTSANMQGGTMLVETMAQYSAMLVMEHLYGPEHVRKFLKSELDAYLRSRGSEEVEELPLDRVEDQGYIHYRKGAVVMYRLKETVGEAAVDRTLQRLLKQYAFRGAPYPTTRDFIRIVKEESGHKHDAIIDDLFDRITLYDLKATGATWVKRHDGRYDVTLTVDAHKYYADGKGKQTEAKMAEDVNIGLFTLKPSAAGFGKANVLSYAPMHIVSGTQSLHLVTAAPPKFAGIDPYNMWIDRNSDDNTIEATQAGGS